MRYKGNTPEAKKMEWVVTALSYATFDGIRVPDEVEATWRLDEGPWTWLKLKVDEITYGK